MFSCLRYIFFISKHIFFLYPLTLLLIYIIVKDFVSSTIQTLEHPPRIGAPLPNFAKLCRVGLGTITLENDVKNTFWGHNPRK